MAALPDPEDDVEGPLSDETFPLIVIPDSQAILPPVLEALVLTITHARVQCCLLLGVCTTQEAFHNHLTVATSSRLAMHALSLKVWCGVVWCGVVWCGVVWCGVVWCGVVWCGVV